MSLALAGEGPWMLGAPHVLGIPGFCDVPIYVMKSFLQSPVVDAYVSILRLRQGFSALAPFTFWNQIILGDGGCVGCLLTPPIPAVKPQMSPDIAKCPLGDRTTSDLRTNFVDDLL